MNKKILVSLLLLPFAISSSFTKTHTNKTYLMPRSQLDNMALELSSWHTQFMIPKKSNFAGSIQATGFYQQSENKYNLGKYFGYYAENEGVIRDFISITPTPENPANINFNSDDIPSPYIIHNPDLAESPFGGKIRLKPNQEIYGLRLDYYQNLWNFFLKVDLPIVDVKNSINASAIGEVPLTDLHYVGNNNFYNLFDYFAGKIEYLDNAAATNLQHKLTHAKFDGSRSECGVADINVTLGYTFLNHKNCRMALAANVTIPTSNEASGEWLFEPIVGAGDHWGVGGQFDSQLRLWEAGKTSRDAIDFLFFANLKYMFDATEKRTLGLLTNEGKSIKFGQYYLAGKKDEFPVIPLANILTRDVKVEPGLQFELLTGLAFSANNVTFDLGYNLFIKDSEDIFLKNKWVDDTYAVAHPGYSDDEGYLTCVNPTPEIPNLRYGPFDPTSVYHFDEKTIPGPIQSKNLDLEAVKTPTQITHKVYGALNYAFYEWKYPLMLGLGTSYEFASGNAAVEGYNVWVKASVSY